MIVKLVKLNRMPFAISVTCLPLFVGCVVSPPVSFNVASINPATRRVDRELRSINVRLANPNDFKAINAVTSEYRALIPEQWRSALQDALDRQLLFKDGASSGVTISVKILRLRVPELAGNFETEAVTEYTITDRTTGNVLWTEVVTAIGEDELSMMHIGAVRARSSVNRAVQNNIAAFLKSLEQSFMLQDANRQDAK